MFAQQSNGYPQQVPPQYYPVVPQKPRLEPQYNEFGTICNLFNPYNLDPKTMNLYENPKRQYYANPQQQLQEMQRQYQQRMLYLQQQGMYQPSSYGRMPTYQ